MVRTLTPAWSASCSWVSSTRRRQARSHAPTTADQPLAALSLVIMATPARQLPVNCRLIAWILRL